MRYLIFAALAAIILGPYLIWQFILSPYCIKHGKGHKRRWTCRAKRLRPSLI